MRWVFVNDPEDRVQSQVESSKKKKPQNRLTQHYKVRFSGQVEQSKELKRVPSGHPRERSPTFIQHKSKNMLFLIRKWFEVSEMFFIYFSCRNNLI